MHHIVTDGWSLGVLVRELAALYGAYSRRRARRRLPELAGPVRRLRRVAARAAARRGLEAQLGYWRAQLAGAPPAARAARPIARARRAEPARRSLPVELSAELTSRAEGARPARGRDAVHDAAGGVSSLLSRYTGQPDVVVGAPIANRRRREVEGLIGFFVNTLVAAHRPLGRPELPRLLGRVRESSLGAYAHQDVPFEKLVEELRPGAESESHAALPGHVRVAERAGVALGTAGPGGRAAGQSASGTAKFDLMLVARERTDRAARRTSSTARTCSTAATVERMLGHFATLLEGVVRRPEQSDLASCRC